MMHSKRMGESERVDAAMATLMRWKDKLVWRGSRLRGQTLNLAYQLSNRGRHRSRPYCRLSMISRVRSDRP
jgi:hypothetical protein